VVAEGSENAALYRKDIEIANVNFISGELVDSGSLPVFARVRYRQPVSTAKLRAVGDGHYELMFKEPQRFVAAGQSAVFYTADGEMLGGGVII